jgi:hypothetical protein
LLLQSKQQVKERDDNGITSRLYDWYGHLDLGHYRVVNRHRFELFGQWSVESEELEFDIVPDECLRIGLGAGLVWKAHKN